MSLTLTHDGLPEGKTRADLEKLVAEAGEHVFGFSPKTIELFRHYLRRCFETDFQPGRICGTWEQPHTTARILNISTRALSYKERELEDAGLIKRTGTAHASRTGKRDKGIIPYLGGINFAPAINSYHRLEDMLAIHRQQEDQLQLMRLQISEGRATIRAHGDPELIALADARSSGGRTKRITDIDRLEEIKTAIDHLVVQAQLRSGAKLTSHRSEADFAPIIPCESTLESNCGRGTKFSDCEELATITPLAAIRLASEDFRTNLELIGGLSWPNFYEAARRTALQIDIRQWVWGQACSRHGPLSASLSVLAIDRNYRLPSDHPFYCEKPEGALFMISRKPPSLFSPNGLLDAIRRYPEVTSGSEADSNACIPLPPMEGVTRMGEAAALAVSRLARDIAEGEQ